MPGQGLTAGDAVYVNHPHPGIKSGTPALLLEDTPRANHGEKARIRLATGRVTEVGALSLSKMLDSEVPGWIVDVREQGSTARGVPRRDIAEEGARLLDADERRQREQALAVGDLPAPPCVDVSAAGRRLTAKQQAALDYLRANPTATPTELCDAASVSDGSDNRAMFVWRLIDTAGLRLLPPPATRTGVVAIGHGEYLPNYEKIGLAAEDLWDPYENGVQADLESSPDRALGILLEQHPELDGTALPDCDLTWDRLERWTGSFTAWDAAFADLSALVAEVPGGDDDTFDYWPSGARLLLQTARALGEPWYLDNAERTIRATIAKVEADFRDELLQKCGLA